jgi:hypothetical protein
MNVLTGSITSEEEEIRSSPFDTDKQIISATLSNRSDGENTVNVSILREGHEETGPVRVLNEILGVDQHVVHHGINIEKGSVIIIAATGPLDFYFSLANL